MPEIRQLPPAGWLADGVIPVEDIGGVLGEKIDNLAVADNDRSGGVGHVSELVRVDRDRVGRGHGGKGLVDRLAGKVGQAVADLLPRVTGAVGPPEDAGQVASPGPVDMNPKVEALLPEAAAKGDDLMDRVNRPELGRAEHSHHAEHGHLLFGKPGQLFLERRDDHPHPMVDGNPQQVGGA